MTYNQLITEITTLAGSHAMIKQVKNRTPREWINSTNQPEFPICLFTINSGFLNTGRENVYNIQMFFLDKSGLEAEFETDVISDQIEIASDVLKLMRNPRRDFSIDDQVGFNAISDQYEDYLAGVELTFNITTQSAFSACDIPQ